MRRIVIWLASTVTVVVLLFGYHTSTNSPAPSAATAPSAEPSSAAPSSVPSPSSSSSAGTKTYTGDVAQTRWGPVQVTITVVAGKITAVDVPQYPHGNPRDQEINDEALPILIKDTISAQSADVDMISGATVTTDGYLQSLQSALDAAGI